VLQSPVVDFKHMALRRVCVQVAAFAAMPLQHWQLHFCHLADRSLHIRYCHQPCLVSMNSGTAVRLHCHLCGRLLQCQNAMCSYQIGKTATAPAVSDASCTLRTLFVQLAALLIWKLASERCYGFCANSVKHFMHLPRHIYR
jgi:hypothetical protein